MKVTPGNIFPTALQGLQKASGQADQAAHRIASGEIEAKPIVELIQAETAFKANAAVIRTADELNDRLLDILA